MSEHQATDGNAHTIEPRQPSWPEPGYDIAAERTDLTDWSINPDAPIVTMPVQDDTMPATTALLAYATTQACERELQGIAGIVGLRRGRNESLREFAFRISIALQEEIDRREREIADRETLLSLVLSLGQSPQAHVTE